MNDKRWNQLNLDVFVPVVVEPGSVAWYDDVVGLLSHVVLMKVWALHRFTLHTGRAFLLFLFEHTSIWVNPLYFILRVLVLFSLLMTNTFPVVSIDSSSCSSAQITQNKIFIKTNWAGNLIFFKHKLSLFKDIHTSLTY